MGLFNKSIKHILRDEGGYQNMPSDKGNWYKGLNIGTNLGITPYILSKYLGRMVYQSDMKNLNVNTAKVIYKKMFWDKMRASDIKNQSLATFFFDGHVNHGRTGLRLIQRALKALGHNLKADGVIGPITIKAINDSDPFELYYMYKYIRAMFYYKLSKKYPQFFRGWMNRLEGHSFDVKTLK